MGPPGSAAGLHSWNGSDKDPLWNTPESTCDVITNDIDTVLTQFYYFTFFINHRHLLHSTQTRKTDRDTLKVLKGTFTLVTGLDTKEIPLLERQVLQYHIRVRNTLYQEIQFYSKIFSRHRKARECRVQMDLFQTTE